jgi:hypothetical protein
VALYISEDYYRHATYIYLAPRTAQAHWFDGRQALPLAPPGEPARYLFSAMTPLDERIAPFLAAGQGTSVVNERNQYAYMWVEMPQGMPSPPPPAQAGAATVGVLAFEGFTVAPRQAGEPLHLTLYWRASASTEREFRLFVHLLDAEGRMVAQDDSLGYPSAEWQSGERFVTFHTLPLPGGAADGTALEVGLYDTHSGERLPASGPDARAGRLWLPLDSE